MPFRACCWNITWSQRGLAFHIDIDPPVQNPHFSRATTLVSYTLDDFSLPTTRTLATGNSTTYGYNDAGMLDLLTQKDGTVTNASVDYGYNAINNRTYVKYLNGRGDHYDYDSTQQLIWIWTRSFYERLNRRGLF